MVLCSVCVWASLPFRLAMWIKQRLISFQLRRTRMRCGTPICEGEPACARILIRLFLVWKSNNLEYVYESQYLIHKYHNHHINIIGLNYFFYYIIGWRMAKNAYFIAFLLSLQSFAFVDAIKIQIDRIPSLIMRVSLFN